MRDLKGVHVVVTGVIDGESRRSAEEKLRAHGAVVQSGVGQSTQMLVTGARVGKTKLDKARANGIDVVPWQAVWNGTAPAAAWEEVWEEPLDEASARPVVSRRQYGPMLCKAADDLPEGPDWLFEVKWDGYRCIATVDNGGVSMMSRSGKSEYVATFPHIARLLSKWPDVVLDGELVDLDGQQAAMSNSKKAGTSFVVFDVLELTGVDVRSRPLEDRRRVLVDVLGGVFVEHGGDGQIALSPVFTDGPALMEEVVARDWEGVVAKHRHGRYVDGHRGWLKVKRRNEQEFVVLGWVPGKGALEGTVGGLVLGVRENDEWVYVGRVGSGPTVNERIELMETLAAYAAAVATRGDVRMTSAERKNVRWVKPELVVQVAFQKWSPDGRLVIPSLKGLRNDKDPLDVGRAA